MSEPPAAAQSAGSKTEPRKSKSQDPGGTKRATLKAASSRSSKADNVKAAARVSKLEPPRDANRLPQNSARLLHSFGLEASRRNNLCYISHNVLLHSAGNAVHFYNVKTKKIEAYLPSREGHGIGAVAVHPSKNYFAVCEKGQNPGIYVHEYPSLKFIKELHDGTEVQYLAAAFSPDGSMLATVGGFPDFWLSVWDWSGESIILRSKAFSQDVFKVTFSAVLSGNLITSGVGHIRFWKMATTFTGLKLEGAIARFGTVPISDIAAYAELKNGKVISGTEAGSILLWDGGLVKCQLTRPAGAPCHDGMIEVLEVDEAGNQMITAAADGFVRFWDLQWLEQADDGDDKLVVEITPRREVQVANNCKIKGIVFETDHWVVQDEGGALWKLHVPSFTVERILEFHASAITCVASSPINYSIASGGSDGSVRLYNYKEPHQSYSRVFSTGVTALLWLPVRVDSTGSTVIAGFADGVIRILQQNMTRWKLVQALKPHKMDVTAMQLSPDADILATASTDTSIFFFHVSDSFRPIGYLMGPGQISCIDWSPTGKEFLMGCLNGIVAQIDRPDLHPDTSVTFELKVPIKTFTYRLPKPVKPAKLEPPAALQEELAPPSVATAEGASSSEGKPAEGEKEEEPDDGDKPEGGDELNEQAEGEKPAQDGAPASGAAGSPAPPVVSEPVQEEPEEQQPICTSPVRALLYTRGSLSTFYIAIEATGTGFLYECRFDSEEVLSTTKWCSACVKYLGYSPGNKYLVCGTDDGVVRIHSAPVPGELHQSDQLSYWEGPIHDGFKGAVGGAILSFDSMYLASVGFDGSFFTHFLDLKVYVDKEGKPVYAVKAKQDAEPEAADLGAGVYSIEESKQKAEKDRQLILALQKKAVVLKHVDAIKKALSDILKENETKTAIEKMDVSEFEIDPHLKIMIQEETTANVDMAHKELQYESERRNIALRKLRSYFLDDLEVEHVVLHAFRSGKTVSTFRAARLPAEMLELMEEARIQIQRLQRPVKQHLFIKKEIHQPGDENKVRTDEDEGIFKVEHPVGDTMEDRRLLMKKRESEWLAFLNTRPNESYVNEEDALAIKWAIENKGDFKLKSDLEYRAPPELQTNAKRKRNEMILFVEAVHRATKEFNNEFLALRLKKKAIEEQILRGNARIKSINEFLKVKDEQLYVPDKFKDESPEERELVSQEEMDHVVAERKAAEEAERNEGRSTGFVGGFGADKDPGSVKVGRRSLSQQRKIRTPEKSRNFPPSPLEQAEAEAAQVRLKYEKEKIKEKMDIAVLNFDKSLEELRNKKMRTEINLKMAEQKFLTLFEELRLLKVLTPREEELEERHKQKLKDVRDNTNKIQDQDTALENNKQQIQQYEETTKKLLADFEALIGLENPHEAILRKLYLKKIKRSKKKQGGEDGDSDESEEEEEDDDDDDDALEEDDEPEVCPAGVTEEMYNGIIGLRTKRMEQYYGIKDNRALQEVISREKESLLKKKKNVDSALEAVEEEMDNFQMKKQDALNKVDVCLTLQMHQIEYLHEGAVPDNISGALVFSNTSLSQLKGRIEELAQEKLALRALQKELWKQNQGLVRERKANEAKVAEWEKKVIDIQMLKFGQVIDLDALDCISVQPGTEDLKVKLKVQEEQNAAELTAWNRKIHSATDELSRLIKENAACLNCIADIKEKQMVISKNMKGRASGSVLDPLLEKRKEEQEYARLCRIVNGYACEIDDLREKLRQLRTEKLKVYPYSTSVAIVHGKNPF